MRATIRIAEQDNVAVALRDLERGTVIDEIAILEDIPQGHKVALRSISDGQMVVKYGFPIGVATSPIEAGRHVHSHNLQSTLNGEGEVAVRSRARGAEAFRREAHLSRFMGFRRLDGRVGIRNELWIINTVSCVNNAAERIAVAASKELEARGSRVEGVYAFNHPYGCSQLGSDLDRTQRILAGLAAHPNAAGVLVLGLGCESNQLGALLGRIRPHLPDRVQSFNAQDVEDELDEGLQRVLKLAQFADRFEREPFPLSELTIGMKCGGSDGLSGITANPLVGRLADRLAASGGSVLLTEVPEMFGAEQVLFERACSDEVADSALRMVNDFRRYLRSHGQPIDENPSPGNRAGGITTLAEKSLGCIQKGGSAPVARVLEYGEEAPGKLGAIALVHAPGNDGVSSTALCAAGAQIVLFTTGRGTPMGFAAPTLKISTNSALASRKPTWIDFDAGPIALGTRDLEELSGELLDQVLEVASGRKRTKNELNGFREIAIWKDGVTV